MHHKRNLTQRNNAQKPPNLDNRSVGDRCGPSSLADLAVDGRACRLIDLAELPADVAQDMIDRGANVQLLACHGELADRFDVRHLLEAVDVAQAADITDMVDAIHETGQVIEVVTDDVSVAVLERERYWALCNDVKEGSETQSRHSDSDSDSSSSSNSLESDAIVETSYPNKRPRIGPLPRPIAPPKHASEPPSPFMRAAGPSRPPSDIKLAEIIRRTATFIRTHPTPASAEQLLLAKQGANPQFSFLHAADTNHGYFRSLATRDADDELMDVIKATARAVARQGDAMVQLLVDRNRADPMFAFLSPWHRLHTTFRAYVSKETQEMTAAGSGAQAEVVVDKKEDEEVGATRSEDSQHVSKASEPPVIVSSGLVVYSSESDED